MLNTLVHVHYKIFKPLNEDNYLSPLLSDKAFLLVFSLRVPPVPFDGHIQQTMKTLLQF